MQSFKGPISAAGIAIADGMGMAHVHNILTEDTMDLSNSQFASLFVVSSLTGIECVELHKAVT